MLISESELTYEIVIDIQKVLLSRRKTQSEKLQVYELVSELKDLCYQRDYESFNSAP